MKTVPGLLYSLYRITLVDEYEYAAMVTMDEVMAPLLCGTFLAASSILCVNLLIALLTDTFQRLDIWVYITAWTWTDVAQPQGSISEPTPEAGLALIHRQRPELTYRCTPELTL